jgi:hypothetical protein
MEGRGHDWFARHFGESPGLKWGGLVWGLRGPNAARDAAFATLSVPQFQSSLKHRSTYLDW